MNLQLLKDNYQNDNVFKAFIEFTIFIYWNLDLNMWNKYK